MKISDIRPEVYEMAERAQAKTGPVFAQIDRTAEINTRKVMGAFQDQRVSEACFAGTTGYGYDDLGRETLDRIYAQIFGTEAALVRTQFVNGTHALCCAMFALSDPGVLKRLFDLDSDVFRLPICAPAFRKLAKSDPDFVREAAQSDKYGSSVRARAVAELDDPDLLAEIGLQNPDLRYEVMRNKHFNRDQRLLAAVLNDPEAGRSLVEDAAKHIADRSLIQKRLFTEKDPEILRILCSNVPELQSYADDVKKVLGSRPEASVSYGQRQLTEKVIETFGRDAAVKLAGWTDAARHLIAFAETRPQALLPLWDRLDAAITGSETEIRYRRTLNTGKSEWDSAAQDFKFFYDEETWTKKEPTGLVFPPRDP